MKTPLLALLILPSCALLAQTPSTPPQLSPKAAYADAMQPLDSTRAQVANWSDAEIAALKVTVERAADACKQRRPEDFTGDPLIDLARLCAVGQQWSAVVDSTARYIDAKDTPQPLLADAYAAQIDANLHLKRESDALAGAHALLALQPYDELTAEAIDEVLAYAQFAYTPDALELATKRQPLLLAALQSANPSSPSPTSPHPRQSTHEIYEDGLLLAALQQLAAEPEAARDTVATLDAALPAVLDRDEALPIASDRRRYALLGHPLPELQLISYLRRPDPPPQIPAANAITALVLFPDWCAQCVRMGRSFPETVFTVAGHEAYLYGLLAETVPPNKTLSSDSFNPADSNLLLQQTPTLIVPGADFDRLAVNTFPFLLITDANGAVRVAQPIDPNAIQPGNTVDTAIACIGKYWPLHRNLPQKTASEAQHRPARPLPHPPANSLH